MEPAKPIVAGSVALGIVTNSITSPSDTAPTKTGRDTPKAETAEKNERTFSGPMVLLPNGVAPNPGNGSLSNGSLSNGNQSCATEQTQQQEQPQQQLVTSITAQVVSTENSTSFNNDPGINVSTTTLSRANNAGLRATRPGVTHVGGLESGRRQEEDLNNFFADGIQGEEEQGIVAFDAYVVDDEEQAEYRQQRERQLRQRIEQQAYDELVRTLPHAEEIVVGERNQQREQEERAAAQRRRKLLVIRIGAAVLAFVASLVACVVAVRLSKDDRSKRSREDQIAWILEKISGDAIHEQSSPRHDAFRWLIDTDPMLLRVGGPGVTSFTIAERYVVVLFFFVTGGLSNWTNTLGFLTNTSVCNWWDPTLLRGVSCHDSGSVRGIHVSNNNLYGTVPDELSALSKLEEVVLSQNKLLGTIPTSLGKSKMLETIVLDHNSLSGTVPNLSNLANLKTLDLSGNSLGGSLPEWVTSSSELKLLNIEYNYMTGTIPPFASRHDLEKVILNNNFFEGKIPPSLGFMSVLEYLSLYDNLLSGSIPTLIGQTTMLFYLFASRNGLTGTIPTEIGYLQNLRWIELNDNSLTGPIPTELGELTNLVRVSFERNQLTGTIPPQVAGLEGLQYLFLSNNTLTGDVSELCFQGGMEHEHGFEQLNDFHTDCGDTLAPEVVCPCCTHCCNDVTGSCSLVKTRKEKCQERAQLWEESTSADKGTVCKCSDGGDIVSCRDSYCMYCNNAEGTDCYIDGESGIELGVEGIDFFSVSIQNVRGRDERVSFQIRIENGDRLCFAAINGRECASCTRELCVDGSRTFGADCVNLGYGYHGCHGGDDPFYMLRNVVNAVQSHRKYPARHDCVPYNTSELLH